MLFNLGYSIKINEQRCLNQKHYEVGCAHCTSNCPSGAITEVDDKIVVNYDQCMGCGLCLSICPTQVFYSKQWDETTIIQKVKENEWETTQFFCGNHSTPFKKSKDQSRGAVQIPACLCIISKGAWYELGLTTKIELYLDQCEECPVTSNLARLEYNIGTATEWLEAVGHIAEINYIFQNNSGKTTKNLKAIETGLKITSRRDFLMLNLNKGKQLAKENLAKSKLPTKGSVQERKESLLPDWQKRLAKIYPQQIPEGSSPAYWPTIKISDQCVNCGLCSSICPTKTLELVVNKNTCDHYFTNGLCIDCRLCQLFCPQDAIVKDRVMEEKPFEAKKVFTSSITYCKLCGSTTVQNANNLCYWCREEEASEHNFMDNCRKVFLKEN